MLAITSRAGEFRIRSQNFGHGFFDLCRHAGSHLGYIGLTGT